VPLKICQSSARPSTRYRQRIITRMDDVRGAYRQHRTNARKRGVVFLLTYDEWLSTWTDSGHLCERGRRGDQYCMSRPGDRGPYAAGNVATVTNEENARQKKTSAAFREAIRRRSSNPTWRKNQKEASARANRRLHRDHAWRATWWKNHREAMRRWHEERRAR
jgi:hypothetical protein